MDIFLKKLLPYYKMLRLGEQSVILVAFFFSVLDAHFYDLRTIFWVAIGLLLHSVSIFVLNEFIDAKDTDKYSAKVRALTQNKVVGKLVFSIWLILIFSGSVILIRYNLYWQNFFLILLNIAYSVPPIRTKAKFAYDMATVYAAFIFIPYSIGFSLNGLTFYEMLSVPFIALTCFLGVAQGVHLLGDLDADKRGGLQNTSVVLGYKNLLKLLIIFAFGAAACFTYLLYQHTHWWYYPLLFFTILGILALGYARGNVYDTKKLVDRFSWSTNIAVYFGNYLFIYQILIIYLLSRTQ